MVKNCCHLTCDPETKEQIMFDCVKEFIAHHPEFSGMHISSRFILKKIAEYYLKDRIT